MAVVYQHRRLDNNEIFYIGIEFDTKKKIAEGKRAKKKGDRSKFWYNIINKTGYKIEILFNDLDNKEAIQIEKYLIAYYGRKDLGLGNLCNLTDGGEGSPGCKQSEETKLKKSIANKGKNKGENNGMYGKKPLHFKPRFGKDNFMFENPIFQRGNSNCAKKIICTETGKIWDCVLDCSEENNIKRSTLAAWLNGQNPNKSTFIYYIIN